MALKYQWKAIKQDNSEMDQFTGPTENLFSGVMTELGSDNIKEFRIYEQDEASPKVYCLDLNSYKFYRGTVASPHAEDLTPGGISGSGVADLIFKRRNDVRVDEFGHPVDPPRAIYVMGFKISGTMYAMYVQAKVGQLDEIYVAPAVVTNERPW
jgi:hypothetical protein